jgi:purine-binding chemotaxis protein CheW
VANAPHLVARAGEKRLALRLGDVVEVMRPLPVSTLAGTPSFVLGAAIVRGSAVPVIDARALLGERPGSSPDARFVSLRTGERRTVLAVDAVLGVRTLDADSVPEMPPLLREAGQFVSQRLGTLDRDLLLVLDAGRLVPEAAWRAMAGADRT